MLRDAVTVVTKDMLVELRSHVLVNQMLPFALLALVLFAFAADARFALLTEAAPGLFWVAVVLSSLLAVQRSFGMEDAPGVRDALRLSGMDPAGVFLGKTAAIFLQLVVLELVLGVGIVVFYEASLEEPLVVVASTLVASIAIAAAGTIYGVLSLGVRVRETLLPILLVPVLAPVLLGATRALERGLGLTTADAWSWTALLGLVAAGYLVAGLASFGTLLEDG